MAVRAPMGDVTGRWLCLGTTSWVLLLPWETSRVVAVFGYYLFLLFVPSPSPQVSWVDCFPGAWLLFPCVQHPLLRTLGASA